MSTKQAILEALRDLDPAVIDAQFMGQIQTIVEGKITKRALSKDARRLANARRRERKAARDKERAAFVQSALRVGMIVQMEGTRDRYGYRLVVEIGDREIVCRKLVRRPVTFYEGKKVLVERHIKPYIYLLDSAGREVAFDLTQDITRHGLSKVRTAFTIFRLNGRATWAVSGVLRV